MSCSFSLINQLNNQSINQPINQPINLFLPPADSSPSSDPAPSLWCFWTGSCPSTCWCPCWCWSGSAPASTSWSRASRTPTSGATSPYSAPLWPLPRTARRRTARCWYVERKREKKQQEERERDSILIFFSGWSWNNRMGFNSFLFPFYEKGGLRYNMVENKKSETWPHRIV